MKVGKDYVDGVILADLHSGSRLSPKPEHFQLLSGEPSEPNEIQRGLNRAIEEVVTKWCKPHVLVLVGDALDGQGRRTAGVEQWSTQPLDQVKCAAYWVNRFEAENVYVVRGSGYHVTVNGLPAEEWLAEKELNNCRPVGTGAFTSGIKFIYSKFGIRLHFAHHVPTSQSEWFLTTPIAKEGIRLRLQMKRLGEIDAIFRAHNHYYAKVEFGRQILVSCPAWQFPTEWLHKRSGEPLTDIGAVRFRIYREPDDFGKRLRIQKLLFEVPEANTREVTT